MTKQEYIDTTNLTKLRIAQNILADCIIPDEALGGHKLVGQPGLRKKLDLCVSELEKRIDKHKEEK